ncbi:MAG: GntR family transcriptional regulator [Acidobacteria bacterium]|nr:GntR family transcriptional regulator [Acidobacteriota bacterium]MCI0722029.1 GntR family transcriptional regulator [Acidobacteriota bacterium]
MPLENVIFRDIQVESLRDKVVAALKDAFFSGTLKPGDMIVERELARRMNIGTPAIREALITLQEQGFVRRVANTATYVSEFSVEDVRQLYQLRVEFELLALQWAKPHVTENDLTDLEKIVTNMVEAAEKKRAREFYESDLKFHKCCWTLSRNPFLARSLETLVTPLFAFVLNASEASVEVPVAREHLNIVNALRNLNDPEFSAVVRATLSSFALRGTSSMVAQEKTKVK